MILVDAALRQTGGHLSCQDDEGYLFFFANRSLASPISFGVHSLPLSFAAVAHGSGGFSGCYPVLSEQTPFAGGTVDLLNGASHGDGFAAL